MLYFQKTSNEKPILLYVKQKQILYWEFLKYPLLPLRSNYCTTFVRPLIKFAVPVWSPYLKGDTENLERVQHRVVIIIPSEENYHMKLKFVNEIDSINRINMPTFGIQISTRGHDRDTTEKYANLILGTIFLQTDRQIFGMGYIKKKSILKTQMFFKPI